MSLDAARPGVMPARTQLAPLAVLSLIWGVSYPVVGIALVGLDPWTVQVVSMVLGGGALLAAAALAGASLAVPRALWRDLTVLSLINMTGFQVGMMFGVYFMGAGRTSVLVYTMPVWASVFARLLLGEPITARRVVALGLGVLAVAALLGQDLDQVRDAPLGALLTVFAAASYGLGTVWTKRRSWPLDLPVFAGWQLVIGSLPLVPIWLVALSDTAPASAPVSSWLAVLFLALVSNAIAYVMWFRLVGRLSATVVSLGTLLTPCIGVLASALLLGEAIQPNDLLALALVCGALVLVLFERRAPAGAP